MGYPVRGGRTRLLVLLGHCPKDVRLIITGLAKRVVAETQCPEELKKAIQDIYAKGGHEGVRWACSEHS